LLLALNKMDCIDGETASNLARRFNAVAICALDRDSLLPLIERMDSILWPQNKGESM
jgi:50S ribosomal subunit-associated GTPase HflX